MSTSGSSSSGPRSPDFFCSTPRRADKRSSSSAPTTSDDEFEHVFQSKKRNQLESPSSTKSTASQPFSSFFDDDVLNNFGLLKKGTEKRPLSNFRFILKVKVSSVASSSTGYIVEVFAEDYSMDGDDSQGSKPTMCYFTSESSMRKENFLQQINISFGGGLTCSLNDLQLSEYIQQRIRNAGKLPIKYAVSNIGLQGDGTWVLGPDVILNSVGEPTDSRFVWIGHLFDGKGIAPQSSACDIALPLSASPLRGLIDHLKLIMKHNFIPSLMALGCGALALHYSTILETSLFCPVPLFFGPPGTGKTSALRAALSLIGISQTRFYSKATTQKYVDLCCNNCLPLGIDDPHSPNAINELTIALFNGAKEATIGRGTKTPKCMALISANFTVSESEKYISRCVLLQFKKPSIDPTLLQYSLLPELFHKASSSIGLLVSLGSQFKKDGLTEIDSTIMPKLKGLFKTAIPRVLTSYAIVLWFSIKILQGAGLEDLCEDLYDYFAKECIPCILSFQSRNDVQPELIEERLLDNFAQEFLKGCNGLSIHQIWTFARITQHDKQPVIALRLENITFLKPSTISYLKKTAKSQDFGINGERKYFLEKPTPVDKVTKANGKQCRSTIIFLRNFSSEIQLQLKKAVTTQEADTTSTENADTSIVNNEDQDASVVSNEIDAIHGDLNAELVESDKTMETGNDVVNLLSEMQVNSFLTMQDDSHDTASTTTNTTTTPDNTQTISTRVGSTTTNTTTTPDNTQTISTRGGRCFTRSQGKAMSFSKNICKGNLVLAFEEED